MTKNWNNLRELIEYPKSGILNKEVVKNNKFDVSLFCMAKGTQISEHTSTKQGLVYVIDGHGEFNLEGEKIVMEPGIFISMNENAVHSLKSESNLTFVLILNQN